MNALTRDLAKLVETAEQSQKTREELSVSDRKFREKLHLMPPVGWLNDPNGLCQFQGIYHAFFQYSPFDAEGGVKMRGHYTSTNMIDWEYQDTALYPDQPFDCHGVYSGSAFIEDGKMYLYYTGNVKLEDGEYDYIRTGREGNTILVMTEDGKTFGKKKELMRNSDYPDDLTCHVRDPKVWKENDIYYMVQGARTNEDVGQVLVFESEDKINWKFRNRIESENPFGYMWECPDYFEIGTKKLLSTSVQGLEGGIWDDCNVYQSGYFEIEGEIFLENISCQNITYGIMDLIIMHRRALRQKTDEEFTSAGWECRTVKSIQIRRFRRDGSTALHFREKSSIKMERSVRSRFAKLDEKKHLVSDVKGMLSSDGYPVYELEF